MVKVFIGPPRLTNLAPGHPGSVYELELDPFEVEPPSGPAGRDWDRFVATDEHEASFEWRSGAERVLLAAAGFVEGTRSVAQCWADPFVARWADRAVVALSEQDDSPDNENEDSSLARALALVLAEPEQILGADGPLSFYRSDEDDHYHDASAALPLPDWVSRSAPMIGGIASAFRPALLLFEPGRNLKDLERWLKVRERSGNDIHR